jgi:cation:H+ antiporter
VLLGAVTSLPELAVATTAALAGQPALSINDVLGSPSINVTVMRMGMDSMAAIPPNARAMSALCTGTWAVARIIACHLMGDPARAFDADQMPAPWKG